MQKRILIISDAGPPQINGVVTTLNYTIPELEKCGFEVLFIYPNDKLFTTVPLLVYPEIKLVVNPWKLNSIIRDYAPDYLHIATEGPLAFYAALYCSWKKLNYTSSYHTKIPEYMHERCSFINPSWIYKYLKRIHRDSKAVLVTTESMKNELDQQGFKNLVVWGRGVDTDIFNSSQRSTGYRGYPVLLYTGRISVEKNIESFLDLDFRGTKVVVGDGPLLKKYQKKYEKYANIYFIGARQGHWLASFYANADVFVFPSLTDTFGIVMIEASACGTPVAAFPVTGPIDYIKPGITGYMDNDLKIAIENCLTISRKECEEAAALNTWENCTKTFIDSLYSM